MAFKRVLGFFVFLGLYMVTIIYRFIFENRIDTFSIVMLTVVFITNLIIYIFNKISKK